MSFKKSPIIEPEKIRCNTDYTFTISPEDSMQYWQEPNSLQREKKFYEQWTVFLKKHVAAYADYKLHVEISRSGRLHMHGVIKFLSIKDFFLYSIQKLQNRAQIEIDSIEDMDVWTKYITKQQVMFPKLIENHAVYMVNIEDYCVCGEGH